VRYGTDAVGDVVTATAQPTSDDEFRHEAFLYATEDEFVAHATRFIRDGLARDEAVLTLVDARKIGRVRTALGEHADDVHFADMAQVGRNPALIIQTWRDFVSSQRAHGYATRGIGEPVFAGRNEAALVECQIHEALLNVAFRADPSFWLLCPYDTASLPLPVIEQAIANHPFVCDRTGHRSSETHHLEHPAGFTRPLPAPTGEVEAIDFDSTTLQPLRRFVGSRALEAGVARHRVAELVVAASEIATNTIVHGKGAGGVRIWTDAEHLLCEIHGPGHITDPFVGRLRPPEEQLHGRGVWLANQFCDLVQIRSTELGTTVRLHVSLA
jgi:anti-sigma regulatory factor (Ser/Thr protein kinase)